MVAFHVLRILAVGTVIKYMQGQLPLHFVILGSTPDLMFALSAVVLLIYQIEPTFLIGWHWIGLSVFYRSRNYYVFLSTFSDPNLPR